MLRLVLGFMVMSFLGIVPSPATADLRVCGPGGVRAKTNPCVAASIKKAEFHLDKGARVAAERIVELTDGTVAVGAHAGWKGKIYFADGAGTLKKSIVLPHEDDEGFVQAIKAMAPLADGNLLVSCEESIQGKGVLGYRSFVVTPEGNVEDEEPVRLRSEVVPLTKGRTLALSPASDGRIFAYVVSADDGFRKLASEYLFTRVNHVKVLQNGDLLVAGTGINEEDGKRVAEIFIGRYAPDGELVGKIADPAAADIPAVEWEGQMTELADGRIALLGAYWDSQGGGIAVFDSKLSNALVKRGLGGFIGATLTLPLADGGLFIGKQESVAERIHSVYMFLDGAMKVRKRLQFDIGKWDWPRRAAQLKDGTVLVLNDGSPRAGVLVSFFNSDGTPQPGLEQKLSLHGADRFVILEDNKVRVSDIEKSYLYEHKTRTFRLTWDKMEDVRYARRLSSGKIVTLHATPMGDPIVVFEELRVSCPAEACDESAPAAAK